jgi:hypothetical protein
VYICTSTVLTSMYSSSTAFTYPFPHSLLLTVCSRFLSILFLHRCCEFQYYPLSFFSLFSHPLATATSFTFENMLCLYFYVYILLLVFLLSLYYTFERKTADFCFLNLTNVTKDNVFNPIHVLAKDKIYSCMNKTTLYVNPTFS